MSIGDDVFVVIGILQSVGRKHDLLSSVIMPEGTARAMYNLLAPESVVVETRIGAAKPARRPGPPRPSSRSGFVPVYAATSTCCS